jgi:hypothetical protein
MSGQGQGHPGPVFLNGHAVINNLAAAAQYAANINTFECVNQSLYDSNAYAAAGQAQLTFFQNPLGSGLGVLSAAAKTLEDTNMQAAGAMPNMQAFIVASIEVEFQPDITFTAATMPAASALAATAVITQINDAWIFRATGYLVFTIGQKPYLQEGPMMKFPASNDLEIDAALCDTSTAGTGQKTFVGYAKAVGPAYALAPNNLLLIPMQNFSVTLNWATVQAVTTKARVFVRLMGQLLRSAQ